MIVLLRADRKVQRLKRPCLPAIKNGQESENLWVGCNPSNISVEFMRVLDAQAVIVAPPLDPPTIPIVTRMQGLFDALCDRVYLRVGEINNSPAVLAEMQRFSDANQGASGTDLSNDVVCL